MGVIGALSDERGEEASNLTFEMAARMITETLGDSATSSLRDSVLSESAAMGASTMRRRKRKTLRQSLMQVFQIDFGKIRKC